MTLSSRTSRGSERAQHRCWVRRLSGFLVSGFQLQSGTVFLLGQWPRGGPRSLWMVPRVIIARQVIDPLASTSTNDFLGPDTGSC